jgi:NifB/MoaA-like Fe-S oxidoreductase
MGARNARELQREEEFDAIVLDQQRMWRWRRLMADDVHVLHMQKMTTQEHSRLVGNLDASQPYQLL